ncbi:MAG: rhodanese-like domain-containing protein [Pseudomonadota bacterium]
MGFRLVTLGVALALSVCFANDATAKREWSRLMNPEQAVAAMRVPGLRIVDIRHRKLGFVRGHIPGSVSMPFWSWRGPRGNAGRPPSEADLSAMVSEAGLNLDDQILIVHSGLNEASFAGAAWVYWVMKSSGFAEIAILDGGIRAWKAAGGAVTKKTSAFAPTRIEVTFDTTWLASTDEVEQITSGNSAGTLLDARADEVQDTRTISGAMSYAMTRLLEPSRQKALTPLDTLEKLKNAPINWQAENVVTFCNNGMQGAATWFMASEIAGIRNVKLYAESLAGWMQRPSN